MKLENIKSRVLNSSNTESYFTTLAEIVEIQTDVSIDVKVKKSAKKELVTFSHDGEIITRVKCSPNSYINRKASDLIKGAFSDLDHLFKVTKSFVGV